MSRATTLLLPIGLALGLEDCGYAWRALDAWAYAALLAARAGRTSVAQDRALAITEHTGMQHLLGPLPETCWLTPQPG